MATKKQGTTRRVAHYRPHARVQLVCDDPSLTRQSEAKAADINTIMRKYDRTGLISHLAAAEGVFVDVSGIGSYQESIQQVELARSHFMELPANLRAEFANDPAAYLDWSNQASEEDRQELYHRVIGSDESSADQVVPQGEPRSGEET